MGNNKKDLQTLIDHDEKIIQLKQNKGLSAPYMKHDRNHIQALKMMDILSERTNDIKDGWLLSKRKKVKINGRKFMYYHAIKKFEALKKFGVGPRCCYVPLDRYAIEK